MRLKPLILITNDDGISAPGIRLLIDLIKEFADAVVVAPDKHMSATSHSITTLKPIYYDKLDEQEGYKEYSCTGTPVDCVKLALTELMDRKPDLVLSGINHGSNSSSNVIYSGTMGAAIEGAISGLPSMGISLQDNKEDADFTAALHYTKQIINKVLSQEWENGICLNVNVPKGSLEDIKGIKVSRQAFGTWHEIFNRSRNEEGKTGYTLGGWFEPDNDNEGSDDHALNQNYVSVVPLQFDFTDHKMVGQLSEWND
ncbi:MAG: 5'/3'-nucleotidase SurE [Bacteroidetes bacterium]|nr:5'/3'-nucleotidase SurE [Bacteroidota bacterium]